MSRRAVVPAAAEDVWAAMTAPDRLRQWFGADVEFELVAGGTAVFRGHDGDRRRGTVLEVQPPRLLRFRWWPLGRPLDATTVVIEVHPRDEGASEVVVTERRDEPATLAGRPVPRLGMSA